ncbi:MAG: hypothetical protein H6Q31_1329 [Bacteroidetes bacterium]|jgi:hypothetical protein|nr:hypothetical protein [Bacteroidota bacterium]
MAFRLLWRVVLSVVTLEFRDAWLTLLVLWIHIRHENQVVSAEDQGEKEADDRD